MDAVPQGHPPSQGFVTIAALRALLAAFPPPQVLDVRRTPAFERDPVLIPGSVRCAPEDVDAAGLEGWRPVVAVCDHGHEVSQAAARRLEAKGYDARWLEGGLERWRAEGGPVAPWRAPTEWVTRERPKIDRIACPWLVRRFVDPSARFHYVPAAEVREFAARHGATPYDVPDVDYTHRGAECSFDAFVRLHAISNPTIDRLARIVRGADTGALDLAAQAPGLVAVSLGLSRLFADDHEMLRHGMLVYDALYAWCGHAEGERPGGNAVARRATEAAP